MNKTIGIAAYLLGLVAIAWVAAGYALGHPLALTMTLLIAAVYGAGGLELHRFHAATTGLHSALQAQSLTVQPINQPADRPATPPTELHTWLAQLPAALQQAVHLRIRGERAGLPGPAMTPYLVGLLVLLGMLGTFLGMVVTLQGATSALESTTDVAALRAALSAPVKGLGLAFGTSVAGVAASSMLGLVSALCRRARLQAAQTLSLQLATTLRHLTPAHQRAQERLLQTAQEQTRAQQFHAQNLQVLEQGLQLQQQTRDRSEQHQQWSQQWQQSAELQRQQTLQKAIEQQQFLHDQQQLLHQAQRAEAQQQMAHLQEQAARQHDTLMQALQQQFAALSRTLPEATAHMQAQMAEVVQTLAKHSQQNSDLQRTSQDQFHSRYQTSTQAAFTALADSVGHSLRHSLTQSAVAASAVLQPAVESALAGITRESAASQQRLADSVQTQLDGLAQRLHSAAEHVSATWSHTAAQQDQQAQQQAVNLQTTLTRWTDRFEAQSAALLQTVQNSHSALQAHSASSDAQRLALWTQALTTLSTGLHQSWQQASADAQAQGVQICKTLEHTAAEMQAQAQAQTRSTVAEVTRLLDTAAQAPRVAAEVVGQLRQQLSDSLARDNTLLEERNRMLETVAQLLDTVNSAATEQRGAIDSLVAASTTALQQASVQLNQRMEEGTARLAQVAVQTSASAVEVASLGDAFGAAVHLFSSSTETLTKQLQRIEQALDKTSTRSDEQLAYYVAQAREVIDLSLSAQKQVVDELQRVARPAEQPTTRTVT